MAVSRPQVLVGVFAGMLLLGIGLPAFVYFFVVPPPQGEPVAARDITSGEPFELGYAATDVPQRLWLDMTCEACSLPVDGKLEIVAGGTVLKSVEISAGSRAEWVRDNALDQQLLTEVPAQPSGTGILIRGTLVVPGERGMFSKAGTSAAPPTVRAFRISVAP